MVFGPAAVRLGLKRIQHFACCILCAILIATAMASGAVPQTLVSGRVVDSDGSGMSGVLATLLVNGFFDSTDSDGYFSVTDGQATVRASLGPARLSSASVTKGIVRLRGGSALSRVRVRVLNVQGRRVAEPFNGLLAPNRTLFVPVFGAQGRAVLARGVYLLEITINGIVSRRTIVNTEGSSRSAVSRSSGPAAAMGKSQAVVDTLRLTKSGCPSKDVPVSRYGSDLGEVELLCPSGGLSKVGAWPLDETGGTTFADGVGSNDATLTVPDWTEATHECDRPGIAAGSDHALEVSNGGPAIPMASGYKQAAMSLVIYVEPRATIRGLQYWNPDDERYGREVIADCDDGSTPGSFRLYRHQYSSAEWRLGGYVRDGAGSKQYFGESPAGVSGATMPIDTSKRIVLTQGPEGAALFLDGALVASLPAVTSGWSSLTDAITLGSTSNPGHANDRSPLWGRLDEVAAWQGRMALADVQALPAAAQSLLYRVPTDGPLYDITDYASVQACVDAAAAGGGYVYQASTNTTWYSAYTGDEYGVRMEPGCRGWVGLRLKRQNNSGHGYALSSIDTRAGMGGHTNNYKAGGGWKYIGCKWDGNARGQSGWTPGYSDEFAWCLGQASGNGYVMTITVDACEFDDGTSDGISVGWLAQDQNYDFTVKSTRFRGTFRGPTTVNSGGGWLNVYRSEMTNVSPYNGSNVGCGLCIEPFYQNMYDGNYTTYRDVWFESDWDEEGANHGSTTLYCNVHDCSPGLILVYGGHGSNGNFYPINWAEARYCTIHYYHHGGATDTPLYPSSWGQGWRMLGRPTTGFLFDHTIFVASGRHYMQNGEEETPNASYPFAIRYMTGTGHADPQSGDGVWTMRDCQFRACSLPGGLSRSNVQAIQCSSIGSSRRTIMDGVTVDAAFADLPFDMGGCTVYYRNCVHEGSGSTTPWANGNNAGWPPP